MGKHNIEKKSFWYSFLYVIIWFWHNVVFYRKVVVQGKQNIPKGGHVIFTPNHQNALMDALALLFNIKRQLIFVARADIFSKKAIASILYFLKILPIYRIRDGVDSLQRNKEIFAKTVEVLEAGNGLVILPEGNHGGKRRLRPLKKGFARIAFQTEEANDFGMDIKIVPMGLDYSDYESFRSTLLINFGEPISLSDYYEIYRENQALALNRIKDDLAEAIRKVMIDIKSVPYYELYDNLRNIYSGRYCKKLGFPNGDQPNKFKADKLIIKKLEVFEEADPKGIKSLDGLVRKYIRGIKGAGINSTCFENGPKSIAALMGKSLLLLILLPLFLFGLVVNIIPYQISLASTKIFKDRQFFSSVKLVVSLLMALIFYSLETWLFSAFAPEGMKWYYFLASLPLSGIIAWTYYQNAIKLQMDWRLYLLKTRKAKTYRLLRKMLDNIFEVTDKIVG